MYVERLWGLQGNASIPPPNAACPPLFQPSLALRVVPLGLILLVDASIMLANIIELSPPESQPSFKTCPLGGQVEAFPCSRFSIQDKREPYIRRNIYILSGVIITLELVVKVVR